MQMTEPRSIADLRANRWIGVPTSPGVYWWYFPRADLDRFRISELCKSQCLQLRYAQDGKVCLYHGMANDIAERLKWHAAQRLTLQSLQSGFLSTFRFTLLALNEYDYLAGACQIDNYFDSLSIAWQAATTREEAESLERAELQGPYHYPLNIQGNRKPELRAFVRHLRSTRSAYKRGYFTSNTRTE